MKPFVLLSFAVASAASLVAQSNVVVGLDGKLEILDNITYWGRRGAAHPNGEVGLSMRNTMCNPGSVSIPWYAQMLENHPKFGFMITRLTGDRMVQISDRSYCKHAFTSASTSGACGPCNGIGGSLMGVTCSDTYTAGHNAGRGNLGPPSEIDPWLGTWEHIGSYFDRGDPDVGAPGNTDGNQSPISAPDEVKNRVTVKEADLLVPNSQYFYAIQLIHEGEAVANRWDNIKSRGFVPTYSGNWSVSNSAIGEVFGSVLQHWTGAEVNSGGNGNDDGRFFVASKVTPLGGGSYHYEYAVHNVDNSRGGASFRVPIDAGATASNFSFRDIDTNALNDWTAARVGNEVVFTAPAANPLDWNTIFNFGFDANFPPGSSGATIDEARVGPGALTVSIAAKAPSGSTFAQWSSTGTGCGGAPGCPSSFYEESFDLANSGWTIAANAGNYTLGTLTGTWITPAGTTLTLGDDAGSQQALPFSLPHRGGSTNNLWICSNGFVSVAGNSTSYQPNSAEFLTGQARWAALWHDLNPAAGGTIRFDATAQRAVVSFVGVRNYNAPTTSVTFQLQFWANGTVHCIYQAVATSGGAYLVGYTVGGGTANPGAIDISATLAGGLSLCNPVVPSIPSLSLASSARPIVGTTINLVTSNITPGSLLGVAILSTVPFVPPLDLGVLQMPGCKLYQALDVLNTFPTPGASGSFGWAIPNVPAASGLVVHAQSAIFTPGANPFGATTTNGVQLLLGVN